MKKSDPGRMTAPQEKCTRCTTSACCTYITQQIETPRSLHDFDTLVWQLNHRNVQLFQDEQGWFLLINTPCRQMREDGSCAVYALRPAICRQHENDYCEFDEPAEKSFKRYFPDAAALEIYCRKRFKRWDKRFGKLPA
ncbi:MAG: YkgJ family cysteine cluster protein [Deltaproteobacteria bacterium]|nr:YkgJ family cysteine cluster protein [Deltaproteobacteria bacterium]